MSNLPVTWVLVIDCGISRFLSWDMDGGRLSEFNVTPDSGDWPEDSTEFAVAVADRLKEDLGASRYERLVLISPTEFLMVFRPELAPEVCQRIAEIVGLDLTTATVAQVESHRPNRHD